MFICRGRITFMRRDVGYDVVVAGAVVLLFNTKTELRGPPRGVSSTFGITFRLRTVVFGCWVVSLLLREAAPACNP